MTCSDLYCTHTQSTLLQCLLGELQGIEGTATVSGTLSYTSQEPWIFSGTLRENILFGSPYLPDRYEQVINACTLDKVRQSEWAACTRILSTLCHAGHQAVHWWRPYTYWWERSHSEWGAEGQSESGQGSLPSGRHLSIGWPSQCCGCSCCQTPLWKVSWLPFSLKIDYTMNVFLPT